MKVTIVNCFDTYEQRVDMVLDYFLKKNDDVKVYTSDYRHFKKVKREEEKPYYYFFEAKPYHKNLSVQRLNSHRRLARDIFKKLCKEQNDLLWILLPPNSFVKEAKKFKDMYPETKIIFDIMDMWPETMPLGKIKTIFPFTLWRNLRDKNVNCADFVVTECDLFQEKLSKYVPKEKMKTIYLARKVRKRKNNLKLPQNAISLCYLGSINNIIDIDVIQKIIKRLQIEKKVILHIIGDGEKRGELIIKSKQAGAEVIYHGKVYDPDEKQEIFNSCHYGLNIMKESVYVGLTMKSIDYFEAGLPIINNIKGDTEKMVEKFGIGVNLINLDKINEQVEKIERQAVYDFFRKNMGSEKFVETMHEIVDKLV